MRPVTAADPEPRVVDLPAGKFQTLEWQEREWEGRSAAAAVFLHGLSGVADVWRDTVAALGTNRPCCIALDQRGHGRSPRTPGAYAASDYLGDAIALIRHVGGPVHLVGHSMGARVAILAAARHPELLCSVTIVDIGPEAWTANIAGTSRLFASLPERFASREEALDLARAAGQGEDWAERFVDWRLRAEDDGSYVWLASSDGLIDTVKTQRARNYWRDWDRIAIPALFVRGGATKEVRPRIAAEMRRRNPDVGYVEIADVGHNIPLLAPDRLASELERFWRRVDPPATGSP